LKIVLIEPEIPQNTGNIARLAASLGAELCLAGRLGFSLSDKYMKRAGMDYLDKAVIKHIPSLDDFYGIIDDRTYFISTKGENPYTHLPSNAETLVFGSEGGGFPKYIYETYSEKLFRIPMKDGIRSLNLSSAAAVLCYYIAAKEGFKGLV
jgi:tRNA (cytidine/uridine-2'-O-)-methyltransferase